MSKDKKKKGFSRYIGVLVGVVLGLIIGITTRPYLNNLSGDLSQYRGLFPLMVIIFLLIAFFFHIIVHEAGHLVFGLLTGYKFVSFRIGSFMWLKKDGKLKLKRMSLAGTGGQCLLSPPDIKDGKMPNVLYNLGGSIFNLLLGVLFLIGHLLCSEIVFLSLLFFIFALVGFVTAISNGIPIRTETVDNDGYNALALSKSKEAVEAFWVQLKVNEQISKGFRLKDMPAEWFVVPSDEAMQNSIVATRGVLAYNRLTDEGKIQEADALAAHLLEIDSSIAGIHRSLLICDRIFIELIGENRSEVVDKMLTKELKKFMKSMKRFPSVIRTQYALALLFEKDTAKAQTIKKEFERVAKTYPHSNEIESEIDLFQLVENKSFSVQ